MRRYCGFLIITYLVACPALGQAMSLYHFSKSIPGLKIQVSEFQVPNRPKHGVSLPVSHRLDVRNDDLSVRINRLQIRNLRNTKATSTGSMIDGHIDMSEGYTTLRYVVLAEDSSQAFEWVLDIGYSRQGTEHNESITVRSSAAPATADPAAQQKGAQAPKTGDLAASLFGSGAKREKTTPAVTRRENDDFAARLVTAEKNREKNAYLKFAAGLTALLEEQERGYIADSISTSRSHQERELARLQREKEEREAKAREEQRRREQLAWEEERREQERAWRREQAAESEASRQATVSALLGGGSGWSGMDDIYRLNRENQRQTNEMLRRSQQQAPTAPSEYQRGAARSEAYRRQLEQNRSNPPSYAPPKPSPAPSYSPPPVKSAPVTVTRSDPVTRNTFGSPSSASSQRGTTKDDHIAMFDRAPERVVGSHSAWQPREIAADLAMVNVENQASNICGSIYRAQIDWGAINCEELKSSSGGSPQFQCKQNAIVNCLNKNCSKPYCGTEHRR